MPTRIQVAPYRGGRRCRRIQHRHRVQERQGGQPIHKHPDTAQSTNTCFKAWTLPGTPLERIVAHLCGVTSGIRSGGACDTKGSLISSLSTTSKHVGTHNAITTHTQGRRHKSSIVCCSVLTTGVYNIRTSSCARIEYFKDNTHIIRRWGRATPDLHPQRVLLSHRSNNLPYKP